MTSSPQLADIPGLIRCETTPTEEILAKCTDMTHAVYSHDQIYGDFCTLQDYIDCPPDEVFNYLSNVHNLDEYSVSTRAFKPTGKPGHFVGVDTLAPDTKIFMELEANAEARTLDYYCAWDQGEHLWMIYLFRVIDAQRVLGKPGSVVTWTNCHHPNYDKNPHPELASSPDRIWVGDLWPLFYAGHAIELQNLKTILEYRHANNLPISVAPDAEVGW